MRPHLLLPFAAVTLSACPGPEAPENPPRLWLYLDGAETRVRLIPEEPDPF
jgi:hypothetical protein